MGNGTTQSGKVLFDLFGDRCEPPAGHERAAGVVASVLPRDVDEVRRLSQLAARHNLRLVSSGAGTAPGRPAAKEDGVIVRYDLMQGIRPSGRGEGWVEAEPGATWLALERELRRGGMGLAVYPTSAPRATVGGWLATDGIGVGSFEFGRARDNVLSATVVARGGGLREVAGEELAYYFEPGGATGVIVAARLKTRRADTDLTFAAAFAEPGGVTGAVADLYAAAPLWHLAFISPLMAAARGLRESFVLFGAYPGSRGGDEWRGILRRVLETHGGIELDSWETQRVWGERFYPVVPPGFPTGGAAATPRPAPDVVREFVPLGELEPALHARLGTPLQCTVSRSGEALLLTLGSRGDASPRPVNERGGV